MSRDLEYCSSWRKRQKNQGACCCDRMIVGLQLPMQSVSIATSVVSSNPTTGVAWGQILPRQVVWGAQPPGSNRHFK